MLFPELCWFSDALAARSQRWRLLGIIAFMRWHTYGELICTEK